MEQSGIEPRSGDRTVQERDPWREQGRVGGESVAKSGQLIDGKYRILTEIGRGGMSMVYLARDERLNKQWAIKEIRKEAGETDSEIMIRSAVAEANMIKRLDHPAIVRIVDIIEEPDVIFIVEDYVEGETLQELQKREGPKPQEMVVAWAIQICEALCYLHTRKPPIIYQDMKPANVMLTPEGRIRIIDFGIAWEDTWEHRQNRACLGTKGYAAPEQYGKEKCPDARTDIYGLGMTMYGLLTGQNPGEPLCELRPIRSWNPQLSQGLEEVIKRCTMQDPADRYGSCEELLYALHHYEEFGVKYRTKQRRKRMLFSLAISLCGLCALVGVLGTVMTIRTRDHDYEQNLIWAEASPTYEDRVNFCVRAILIKPGELEAYRRLICVFQEDASFDEEEEALFQKVMGEHLLSLREKTGYAQLAFEIGKLYWYYYEYGREAVADNASTRMKSAIRWFEDAVAYGNETDAFLTMAWVYREIGCFHRDIVLDMEEAADQGKYGLYWENMKTLVDTAADETKENELVSLEVYRLVCYSVETYARKFKFDGVTENDMEQVFYQVKSAAQQLTGHSDKTRKLKADVTERLAPAEEAIRHAYGEGENVT